MEGGLSSVRGEESEFSGQGQGNRLRDRLRSEVDRHERRLEGGLE